jgi:ankyrin repeat protein
LNQGNNANDFPGQDEAFVSNDGRNRGNAVVIGEGNHGTTVIRFPTEQRMRFIRIVLTEPNPRAPYFWSVVDANIALTSHESIVSAQQAAIDAFVAEFGNDVRAVDPNPSVPGDEGSAGETLLHKAIRFNKDIAIVKFLVSEGADVNAKNSIDTTPLREAVFRRNIEVARFLISEGADVNAKNNVGATPLHFAARQNMPVFARLLVSNGADVNAGDNWGHTPLSLARDSGHTEMVAYLESVQSSSDTSTVSNASQSFRSSFPNIFEATKLGTVQDIEYFINNGVDVNINTGERCTPLHIAARYNRLENARYLVSQGADVNATNGRNATPRDDAASAGHTEMVAYLDSVGAGTDGDNPFAD